ncbi:MAG: hypothetical protein R2800_04610 [Flavipsychrobacter sp.]
MSLLTILLQLDTVAQMTPAEIEAEPESLSLLSLLIEGGVLMIPLLACSILMVYVFIERLMVIRKAKVIDVNFMARIREHVTDGNLKGAIALAKSTNSPVARMIEKGLSRIGKPIDHIEKSMENTGKLEIYKLEKNLSILQVLHQCLVSLVLSRV